ADRRTGYRSICRWWQTGKLHMASDAAGGALLWTIETSTPEAQAEITYRLKARGETTRFERELTYAASSNWFWILDFLLMCRRMQRESRIALEQLEEQLEQPDRTTSRAAMR